MVTWCLKQYIMARISKIGDSPIIDDGIFKCQAFTRWGFLCAYSSLFGPSGLSVGYCYLITVITRLIWEGTLGYFDDNLTHEDRQLDSWCFGLAAWKWIQKLIINMINLRILVIISELLMTYHIVHPVNQHTCITYFVKNYKEFSHFPNIANL